ncbi:MAG: 3-deoxy-manno-octulosonate cytidylyltransferase [Phycisphaerae bacterium]|nr:3-deoxy-manno-octulosonate cytidylyltransferase [Phycisphaerae bacterium]
MSPYPRPASRVAAVIPARYGSTRFPGKVLVAESGKPLIQHVVEATRRSTRLGRVIVATDDERVRSAVLGFGGEVVMTRADHPNGTSRIAEAAADLEGVDLIVNVQGDEPSMEPALIDAAIDAIDHDPDANVSTIASPFAPGEDWTNPNVVKVVLDARRRAIYFSRAPIPCWRDEARDRAADPNAAPPARPLKHVGLYVYRRPFLDTFVRLAPTPLERTEQLEQLRVLEHGFTIAVAIGHAPFQGIDTREQYEEWLRRRSRESGVRSQE